VLTRGSPLGASAIYAEHTGRAPTRDHSSIGFSRAFNAEPQEPDNWRDIVGGGNESPLVTMSSTPSSAPPLQPREPTIVKDGADTTDVSTVIIKTDGAYNNDEEIGALGFTIEDNAGNILREGWQEVSGANSSMQAETVAAMTAIRLAKEYNPGYVIVNTDCAQLKHYLTEGHAEKPALELLCEQARQELAEFDRARVRKIKGENNTRADELAGRGLRELRGIYSDSDDIWMPTTDPRA